MYDSLPMFQRVGAKAYNKDLGKTIEMLEELGNPQTKFKSVHIAGTNGKGTSAHMLCSILMESGYKTGLYTSPHLKNFTERIRIDGKEVERDFVMQFVNDNTELIERLRPSFFEITVAMAFDYFEKESVDLAIVEVGMGGRLDSTNVLEPLVSLITNISLDHQQFLGDTIVEIAGEKAGIIKPKIPVVVSERQSEIEHVFENVASERNAPIYYADDNEIPDYELDLKGAYVRRNAAGVVATAEILREQYPLISDSSMRAGLAKTITNTGIKGRWQILSEANPRIICDTGHNIAGVQAILKQLESETYQNLIMVFGTVGDKDVDPVLDLLPKAAQYIFCQPLIPRSMNVNELLDRAVKRGLSGKVIKDVNEAYDYALEIARPEDLIFVGGSTFVVAELNVL